MPNLRTVGKYQRGPCWYLDYKSDTGRKRQSLGRVAEGEAEVARQRIELALNERPLVSSLSSTARGSTLNGFAEEEYLPWHKEEFPHAHPRTESACRMHILPALGHLMLADVTRREVEMYKATRRRDAEPGTVARELSIIQAMVNKAVEWELIPTNRSRGVKPPKNLDHKPAPFYTQEELVRIYEADPEMAPVWKLIANTGMRRAEALDLTWSNIRDDRVYIVSSPTARSKSGRFRVVPLSPGARIALYQLKNSTEYVLPRMNKWDLSRAFDRAVEVAGLGHSLHALRHTFCSHLVMSGVDLSAVQELAGHASILTTRALYVHLSPDHLRSAMSNLDL